MHDAVVWVMQSVAACCCCIVFMQVPVGAAARLQPHRDMLQQPVAEASVQG